VEVDLRKPARQQLARSLAQDSGTIPGPAVGRSGPAMGHRSGGGKRLPHHFMRGRTTQVREESNPTRVVLFDLERRGWHGGRRRARGVTGHVSFHCMAYWRVRHSPFVERRCGRVHRDALVFAIRNRKPVACRRVS
jgi:hypothetical protein